ncbi:Ku protein [Streptomyces roseoverticillatus]|uniref:non-homologous end joining protein Ku n=1 Tax=Streptomyces roseoverticillatus TaxID=66429 RepID=UPI001F489794|nr:Ku protein [Streptomyces roseoverticillatus]MCF3101594.1 Ku protein [Streptomyces roseoverticillatus]
MRTMWKGAIGFGLVSVPVRLYAAVQEHGLRLHQVHDKDGGRIHLKRVCEACGEQVDYEHIAKGYQDDEGHTAVVTQDELAGLPLPSKKLIDVLAFVDSGRIDPLQLSSGYYLAPESAAADKPYVLLRETLKQTERVAVTKIALRTRESLALLRVHGDLLTLHTMYWPDEIRDAGDLAPPSSVTVRPQELKMATSLMDTLSEEFDLEEQEDEYEIALGELINAHLSDRPVPKKETAPAPDNVIDLMAALQASIDSAARKPGEKAERPGRTAKKAAASGKSSRGTAKKSAAPQKRTTGKKTAAASTASTGRKTTAKSTTAKTAKKTAATRKSGGRAAS